MRKLGWIDGQNLRIEVRWSASDLGRMEAYATDLVGLFNPDVLLTATTGNLVALQRATRTIPIVFMNVGDPVEQGLVPNLTHPAGNVNTEFSIAGKWADLLKQMAPSIARVAFVFNPETSPQSKLYVSAAEAAAPSLGVEVMTAPVHSTAEIEAALARFSREPNIGLIFPTAAFMSLRAKLIVETVARYRLPAIYPHEAFMAEGGLMYYRNDQSEPFRLAPFYVDRILKGTKPWPIEKGGEYQRGMNRLPAGRIRLTPIGAGRCRLANLPMGAVQMDMDISTIDGSCHCGIVRFRVHLTNGLHTARRCTCSFCRMRGAIAVSADLGGVDILSGAEALSIYKFNTGTAKHFFCSKCGIYTHHQRRSNPDQFGVNVACLSGLSPFDFEDVVVYDGVNHPEDAYSAKPRVAGHLKFIGM